MHEVGTAATEFAANIETLDDLMRALRSGDYQPAALPY
jgi:hypothetical protein